MKNIKRYSIKSESSNLHDAWQSLEIATLTHAWKNIGFNDDIVKNELQKYFLKRVNISVFRRRGKKITENVALEWLEDGDIDPGYRIMNYK